MLCECQLYSMLTLSPQKAYGVDLDIPISQMEPWSSKTKHGQGHRAGKPMNEAGCKPRYIQTPALGVLFWVNHVVRILMPTFQRSWPNPLPPAMCQSGVNIITTAAEGCFLSKMLCNSHSISTHSSPLLVTKALPSPSGPLKLSQAHQKESSALWHPQRDNHTLAPRCWPISFSQNGPEVGGRRELALHPAR